MSKIKIADFAEVITGGTPSTSNPEYWENGDVPWLQSGACQNDVITGCDTFITQKGLENSAAKMMKPDSVLIALTGATTGKVGYLTFEACANQSVTGIQPNERFVSKYLYYYLRGIRKKILDDSYGGAQKHISQGYVKNIEVPLGSIEEQKTITKLLESVDTTIALRQQELQLLDDLIKARFVEMFGDPDTNPMRWTEHPLSEMLNVLGGYAFKSEGFSEVDGIPVLRIGNINAGFFKPVNMVFWEEDEILERYIMYPGDLVMSLTGTVGKDDYGNVCILGNDYDKYYLNQRNAKLELKEGLDKHYLSQLLRFEKIKKRLTGISRGVRQANISNKDILNLSVPIPPADLQLQYAAFVAQVDKSKFAVQKALDEAQTLFDSLMQQYFG